MVTTGALVATDGALTLDESIGEESTVVINGTERLNSLVFVDVTVLPQLRKDVLYDVGLVLGGGLVEDVEINAEPVIDGFVKGVVLGAKSGRVSAFLEGLGFGGGTVLIL